MRRFLLQRVEQFNSRIFREKSERILASANGKTCTLAVEDRGKHIPRRESRDPTFVGWLPTQPLQHGDVRVGNFVIAVHARIREPAQRLVVAGIGKI